MMEDSAAGTSGKKNALLAIAVGGGIAGTLDLLQACILFGWDIPLVIAGGLLGREAFHPLVCGLFFGAAAEDVMRLIVLPLSALHSRGPYELRDLILGLLVHMVVVGLPISFSVRRFAK
jgi:hypothetical protein